MIAIIDYEAGNLTSVKRALNFMGYESVITSDFTRITKSDRIIFPGVGAAGKAMSNLKSLKLDQAILESFHNGRPILGICLGTQIIMEWSQENDTHCLGLIKGEVRRFPENLTDHEQKRLKVPHMGWNDMKLKRRHPLFEGVDPESEFYFVHSYYPAPTNPDETLGETDYGIGFASVLVVNNLVAMQFHPEKSGRPGLKILSNFCKWNGNKHA
ncbi:MAG: imidazole glycerol phosphate synthase subunit HisH [Thermodesulfobacteriota bacterium]|nr:imidazole glycerol phosphate synthase subunit HisH [Thermodesulfobacteriota bacterium]